MVRRSAEDARAHLLAAAESIFAEEGLDGLSMRRLAEVSGYAPSAVYKHFAGKEDLVLCLKDAFFARVMEGTAGHYADAEGPRARLVLALRAYLDQALAKPHHYLAAFSGPPPGAEEVPDEDAAGIPPRARAFAALAGFTGDYMAALGPAAPDRPPEEIARLLWAGTHGLAHLLIVTPHFGWGDPDRVGAEMIEGLIRGHIPRKD
jgi:AcrR family transcriptional regulator